MNYVLFVMIMITMACVYLLFGYDLSQKWFKANADLVNILLASVGVLAGVLSLLLALRIRSVKALADKSNTVKNIKVSGVGNTIELNQHIDKK